MVSAGCGNEWIYFTKTRQVTGGYAAMRVASTEIVGSELGFRIEGGPFNGWLLNEDDLGRIWQVGGGAGMAPRLVLDPTVEMNPAALYPTRPGAAGALAFAGVFMGALSSQSGSFGKGIGLVELTSTVVAGSSGGFGASYSLVRARVGGTVVRETSDYSLSLGVESRELTLRPGSVANCAVPCYFVACGLVPGADPPGTFKPCMRARLTFQAPVPVGATVELRLTNAAGEAVYKTDLSETPAGVSSLFHQIPLYTAPNLPLPPGAYLLTGSVQTAGGQLTSTIPLQILP